MRILCFILGHKWRYVLNHLSMYTVKCERCREYKIMDYLEYVCDVK